MSIALVAYIAAAVLFFLAAVAPTRAWYTPIGLFCFVLGHILAGVSFRV